MNIAYLNMFHLIILYIYMETTHGECSSHCSLCTGSTCKNCESSYYLSDGNCLKCPVNCNKCDSFSYCTSCKPNKWRFENRCDWDCPTECLNRECQDKTGYCFACKQGKYGFQCQRNCSYRKDGLCNLRACTSGCKSGYYEYEAGAETICQICPSDCKSCSNISICNVCNDGFYLHTFSSNGQMYVYCVQCPPRKNCKTCKVQGNSTGCTGCYKGNKLDADVCIPDENNCAQGCSTVCNADGKCLGSCKAGWTGERCNDACSDKCISCDKSDANICEACKGHYYTITCNVECNPACTKVTGKQTCRLNDGYCNNGCENKFWGPFCNLSCSGGCDDVGVAKMCDKVTGTCKSVCTFGYTGEKCDTIITKQSTRQSQAAATTTETQTCAQCHCVGNGDNHMNFMTGYMSGVGSTVFIIALAAAIFFIRRRYIADKSKPAAGEMSTYYNENDADIRVSEGTANEANNYESLGNSRNADVYNELERPAVSQSLSNYNIGVTQ